jgi:hypothetical protein
VWHIGFCESDGGTTSSLSGRVVDDSSAGAKACPVLCDGVTELVGDWLRSLPSWPELQRR